MTTGKIIALTRWTFVGKVMSLLFNMLSRLVITFLPRNNHLLISWMQSPYAVILEPRKIVCHCFHCFPSYLQWSDGTRRHDVSFLNVEFLFACLFVCLFVFYCSGFCHTLKWIIHGFTCVPHPNPPSHLSLHLIPLGLPSAPGPSACLMHPTWAGDLFHPR